MNVKVCERECGCKCVWVWVEEDAVDVVRRSEWSKGRKEKSKEQREGTTLYACINTKKLKTNAHICPDSSCLALSLPPITFFIALFSAIAFHLGLDLSCKQSESQAEWVVVCPSFILFFSFHGNRYFIFDLWVTQVKLSAVPGWGGSTFCPSGWSSILRVKKRHHSLFSPSLFSSISYRSCCSFYRR